MNSPQAILSPKGERWLRSGHPWIFRGDIQTLDQTDQGEIVRLVNKEQTFLAWAFYSRHSRIAFRLISRNPDAIDLLHWEKVLHKAVERRKGLFGRKEACRLVFSEADEIPGLIADWYAGHIVIQSLIPGIGSIFNILCDIFKLMLEPVSIVLRNDIEVRSLERLPLQVEVLYGNVPERVLIQEGPIRYEVDLLKGQKTGAYLDQRENHLHLVEWVPPGARVLDCFCYSGGFALHLARKAGEVIAVDDSAPALEKAQRNAEINGLSNITFLKKNIFDFLKAAEAGGERFDVIVLDPPPFAKKKADLPTALRGYQELNRRALSCLNPGGILNTYSCSYHITEPLFLEMISASARKAGVRVLLREKRIQAGDHPVLINFPESLYLKGLILQKV
ncbi:MAG: class I SAM-dependent rRNA methyltransferase [Thermodesulfobacteriota bacterium]